MIKPKVVVITINYNQSKMTLECVDSILHSNYENFQLLVIDNGSDKDEYDLLLQMLDPKVKLERINNNCGYVGGVNYGMNKGSEFDPAYYLIMNNDTILDKEAIHYLVDASKRHNDKAIISGKVYHFDNPDVLQYVGGVFKDKRDLKMNNIHKDEKDVGQCDFEAERDMLDDIFWLLPVRIYKQVGNYSRNFFLYGEQADYALQVVNKGYKLIFTPKAKLWHKGSITTGGGNRVSPVVNFWRKKSAVIYKYRNLDRKRFWLFLFTTFYKLIGKNLLNALRLRKVQNRKSEYAALIGTIHGTKWIFNKKPDNGFNPFV